MRRRILLSLMLVAGVIAAGHSQEYMPRSRVFADLKIYQTFNLPRYENNFMESLGLSETEIVESALAQVTMLKLAQPKEECKQLRRTVEDLVARGQTASVRFKAYLASAVFLQPNMFDKEKYGKYHTADEFFNAISVRLQKTTLLAQ